MTARLSEDNVRELIRLCSECVELRLAGEEPSCHFLSGLARLTRSQIVLWIAASNVALDRAPRIDEVKDVGWPSTSDRDRVYQYVGAINLEEDPLCAAVLSRDEPLVTRTRADTMTLSQWSNTEARNDVHRPSGIDDSLLSMARKPGAPTSVLALKRGWGEPAYGPEEATLVHLVHAEFSWVFKSATRPRFAPKTSVVDWSPRERDVLDLLLTGASEKMGAARLNLSPHTFHGYVKTIYKKLGIGSRAELMAMDRFR